MSTVRILESAARPQTASPLFGRLPAELRLLIYKFAFLSCQAVAWFDGEFIDNEGAAHGGPKLKRFRSRHCCFSHRGAGFNLLITCRLAYIEGFETYWAQAFLQVARSIDEERTACGLLSVCKYLPAAIKENLGILLNTKLPIMEMYRSTPDDSTWTPALLKQFPNLRILQCSSSVLFGMIPNKLAFRNTRDALRLFIPDQNHPAQFYSGVAPFHLKTGESPADYIERKIGVQLSGGLTLLTKRVGTKPRDSLPGYKHRSRYFNWTTGMMYQTTEYSQFVHGFTEVMKAEAGSRWSRWYCLPTDAAYRVGCHHQV